MRRKTKSQINKNIKFIRSSEFEATYYFSRTNRKSSYIDRSLKK
jgi:hypothetical protein